MGTEKRHRKKANRAARVQLQQREARRRGLVRRVVTLVAVTLAVLALALLFNLLAGDPEPAGEEQGAAPPRPVPAAAA